MQLNTWHYDAIIWLMLAIWIDISAKPNPHWLESIMTIGAVIAYFVCNYRANKLVKQQDNAKILADRNDDE